MSKKIYDIERLEQLLIDNKVKFDTKQRFIHPRTIANFLFHFYSIKDINRKEHVYACLNNFFNNLNDLHLDKLTPQESISMYYEFINPIVNYYDPFLGFIVHIKWKSFFFIGSILLCIVLFIDFSAYYKQVLLLLFIISVLYTKAKEKKKKTYGVFY